MARHFSPDGRGTHAAPVRITYSSISSAMLPLWIAKDKKLFEKHGVDVEVTYIRGVTIEALLASEVQFVRASPPASFVDATLMQDLEKEGFLQQKSR